jgi:hypothetical protein
MQREGERKMEKREGTLRVFLKKICGYSDGK